MAFIEKDDKNASNPKEHGARSDQTLELARKISEIAAQSYNGMRAVNDLFNACNIEGSFRNELRDRFHKMGDPLPLPKFVVQHDKWSVLLNPKNMIKRIATEYPENIQSVIGVALMLNLPDAVRILKRELEKKNQKDEANQLAEFEKNAAKEKAKAAFEELQKIQPKFKEFVRFANELPKIAKMTDRESFELRKQLYSSFVEERKMRLQFSRLWSDRNGQPLSEELYDRMTKYRDLKDSIDGLREFEEFMHSRDA